MHVPHILSLADDEGNEDDEIDEERASAVLKPGFYSPILATPAASQRVEGILGVMRGRFISRRSSFVGVKAELEKRTEKIAVKSRL